MDGFDIVALDARGGGNLSGAASATDWKRRREPRPKDRDLGVNRFGE